MTSTVTRSTTSSSPAGQSLSGSPCRRSAPPWRRGAAGVLIGLGLGTAAAAPEIDRDAYWIESTVCVVTMKLRVDATAADTGKLLGSLVGAPANCTGNMAAQVVPGGVLALLQRGFRITTAQHQVVPLMPSAHGETEPALLVSALFVLEKPAVKPAPPPK